MPDRLGRGGYPGHGQRHEPGSVQPARLSLSMGRCSLTGGGAPHHSHSCFTWNMQRSALDHRGRAPAPRVHNQTRATVPLPAAPHEPGRRTCIRLAPRGTRTNGAPQHGAAMFHVKHAESALMRRGRAPAARALNQTGKTIPLPAAPHEPGGRTRLAPRCSRAPMTLTGIAIGSVKGGHLCGHPGSRVSGRLRERTDHGVLVGVAPPLSSIGRGT